MCDGVTQGTDGMELSLFSRDVIALSTAVGLSHAMFDGVALLGICDKIVPGLLIGALALRPSADAVHPRGRRCRRASPTRTSSASASSTPKARRPATSCSRAKRRVVSLARHLHVLRHRQFQPDDDGDDGPARARRGVRQPEHAAAPGADPRRGPPAGGDHARRQRLPPARRAASTRKRSSTPPSACSPPAARPTTRSTSRPLRAPRGSSSTGTTSTS